MLVCANQSGELIGHAWVIDGYIYKKYTVYVYSHTLGSVDEMLESQFEKEELYSRINWGWYGKDNGYFVNNALNITKMDDNTVQYYYNENFYYFTINTK